MPFTRTDLVQAERGMARRNGFAHGVRERIKHAVMRMHGGKTILAQLMAYNGNDLPHSIIIITPIANNLKETIQKLKLG